MKTASTLGLRSDLVVMAITGLLWSGGAAAAGESCSDPPSVEVNRFGYGWMLGLANSPDGLHVAAASTTGVVIWNVEKGIAEHFLLTPRQTTVHSVAWSPDGRWLAGGGTFAEGTVFIWSAEDGQMMTSAWNGNLRSNSIRSWLWLIGRRTTKVPAAPMFTTS